MLRAKRSDNVICRGPFAPENRGKLYYVIHQREINIYSVPNNSHSHYRQKYAIISDTTVKMGNDFSAPVPPAPPDFKYFVVTIK